MIKKYFAKFDWVYFVASCYICANIFIWSFIIAGEIIRNWNAAL